MAKMVSIRPLDPVDREMLYRWRNQETQVAFSSSGKRVSRVEHLSWFQKILHDRDNDCFIIEYHISPCGFMRFRKEGKESYISIYLVNYFGVGTNALWDGIRTHWGKNREIDLVVANVVDNNNISKRFFEKNLFKREYINDGLWRYEYELGRIEKILFRFNLPVWAYTARGRLARWWSDTKAKVL